MIPVNSLVRFKGKYLFGRRIILYLFFILFTHSTYSGQENSIHFDKITKDDGLISSGVICITQDKFGFMWFGCEGGLVRYDGQKMIHFTPDPFDSTSISNLLIKSLFVDSKDRLWIGTQGGLNLFDYEKKSFRRFSFTNNAADRDWISSIRETKEDGKIILWLGVFQRGIVKFYPDEGNYSQIKPINANENSLSGDYIFSIYPGNNNVLWIGTRYGGLEKYDISSNKFFHYRKDDKRLNWINDNHIIRVIGDKENGKDILWLGTGSGGLNKFDIQNETFTAYTHNPADPNSINSARILSILKVDNELWLGTINGLDVFNPSTTKFSHNIAGNNPGQLPSNYILDIYKDRSGNVWLGTNDNGVCKYNPDSKKFQNISVKEFDENTTGTGAIIKDSEGHIWLGTMNGILRYDPRSGSYKSYNRIFEGIINPQEIPVISLMESNSEPGVIWIGTFNNGLFRLDARSNNVKRFQHNPDDPESISHNSIEIIFEDSKQNIWLAASGSGLNKFDKNSGKVKRYYYVENNPNSLSNNFILSINEDADKTLWVGTYNGLNKFNRDTDNFERIFLGNVNSSTSLIGTTTQCKTQKEILWIGTGGSGLIKYNKKTKEYTRYSIEDGLGDNTILGILVDDDGSLWMSTLKGITKFDVLSGKFFNFTKSDGLLNSEYLLNPYYKDKDRMFYFGGGSGVDYFHPDSIKMNKEIGTVVLTGLYLFNQHVDISDSTVLINSMETTNEVKLDYTDYVFSIEFTVPEFKKNSQLKFAYMLSGFHDEWIITSSDNRTATFTNIPPGDYTFKVKAANAWGDWNENYTSLLINITPPFWRTWWAYLLYIILFVVAVFSFVEHRSYSLKKEKMNLQTAVEERTKELEKLNADKDRFFSIVAHDIKSPLVALTRFTDIFKKQYSALNENERIDSINEINHTLNNSYRYLTNLLNWSRIQIGRFEYNPTELNLQKLVDDNVRYMNNVAQAKAIEVSSELKEPVIVFADYEMISIVLRNLLSNAIKFSYKGSVVKIKADLNNNIVTLSVEDKGIGLTTEKMEKLFGIEYIQKTRGTENEEGTGLGLILCKELVSKNNGEIFVESVHGKGSKFRFTLPAFSRENNS